MIGNDPNVSEANNQPLSQQPLILPGDRENRQDRYLNTQLTTVDIQKPVDIQPTLAQQPSFHGEQTLDLRGPSGKAYHSQFGYPYRDPFPPEYTIYGQLSPRPAPLFPKLVKLWRSDPAYKVFSIALATVLLSSIICMLLISNFFKQPSRSQTSIDNQTPVMSTSAPINISLPTTTPTPTAEPTTPPAPAPVLSQLMVEITSIPPTAMDHTITSVGITTSEPGVYVTLYVTYSNANPTSFQGPSATTDSNGQGTLPWPTNVHPTNQSPIVTAHVTVFARDPNGQTATSQTVTVQVLTSFGD